MPANHIPEDVAALTARYLQLADSALPGRIEALYLVGSVALADYRPGQSDVDFVAVPRDALTAGDFTLLDEVHKQLLAAIPEPWFDGVYVTWDDLTRDPDQIAGAPYTHEGAFERSGGFEANPSTWLTLRKYGIALRGPAAPTVWHDPAIIRRWNLANLNGYWRAQTERGRSDRARAVLLAGEQQLAQVVAWCVPGVARLHYTISTGDITSKSGACRYALETFPERWHAIIREALALRHGDNVPPRPARVRLQDTLEFMEHVIDDANRKAEP